MGFKFKPSLLSMELLEPLVKQRAGEATGVEVRQRETIRVGPTRTQWQTGVTVGADIAADSGKFAVTMRHHWHTGDRRHPGNLVVTNLLKIATPMASWIELRLAIIDSINQADGMMMRQPDRTPGKRNMQGKFQPRASGC